MDFNLVSALLFYVAVGILIFIFRRKFKVYYKIAFLYKTKFGLKAIDWVVKKFGCVVRGFGVVSRYLGIVGMGVIVFFLAANLVKLIKNPAAAGAVSLVIPGVRIPGSAVYIPFWQGIIAIFVVVLVHEFAHGIVGKAIGTKIKNTGFGFFAIFPIAFVEPDEKQLKKKDWKKQIDVFAAGPVMNFVVGGICFLLLAFLLYPAVGNAFEANGVLVKGVMRGFPAEDLFKEGDIIIGLNGFQIKTVEEFKQIMMNISAGSVVHVETVDREFDVKVAENPDMPGKGYFGIYITQSFRKVHRFASVLLFLLTLFAWMLNLNIGIGLINLLPAGPLDGGRILFVLLKRFFGKKGERIFRHVSALMLLLLVLNFVFPYFNMLLIR
ncbi:hypothetical protein DRJ19_00390 [Candidatus Woesearchaeota archaeon]|nr:MAG: hypothetical protein DRJ19_00390 [Candidatus Woesearchaeota archaeon]